MAAGKDGSTVLEEWIRPGVASSKSFRAIRGHPIRESRKSQSPSALYPDKPKRRLSAPADTLRRFVRGSAGLLAGACIFSHPGEPQAVERLCRSRIDPREMCHGWGALQGVPHIQVTENPLVHPPLPRSSIGNGAHDGGILDKGMHPQRKTATGTYQGVNFVNLWPIKAPE